MTYAVFLIVCVCVCVRARETESCLSWDIVVKSFCWFFMTLLKFISVYDVYELTVQQLAWALILHYIYCCVAVNWHCTHLLDIHFACGRNSNAD